MIVKEWWDFRELLNILDIKDEELEKLLDDASDMLDDMEIEITKELMMSNIHTEQTLEQIHEQVLEDDAKLLLSEEIDELCYLYNLHADDDRDEIIFFIAESIYENQYT
tara:strand:- start:4487 stop:4813 length:327 start_codon:yes stop_codon:yes gene_type:complete